MYICVYIYAYIYIYTYIYVYIFSMPLQRCTAHRTRCFTSRLRISPTHSWVGRWDNIYIYIYMYTYIGIITCRFLIVIRLVILIIVIVVIIIVIIVLVIIVFFFLQVLALNFAVIVLSSGQSGPTTSEIQQILFAGDLWHTQIWPISVLTSLISESFTQT